MIAKGSLLLLSGVTGAGWLSPRMFPGTGRRLQVTSRLSTFAAVAAAVLLAPALAIGVGPSTNGQGQGSAESRSTGSGSSGTSNPNERRSPELFKLGGNIKF